MGIHNNPICPFKIKATPQQTVQKVQVDWILYEVNVSLWMLHKSHYLKFHIKLIATVKVMLSSHHIKRTVCLHTRKEALHLHCKYLTDIWDAYWLTFKKYVQNNWNWHCGSQHSCKSFFFFVLYNWMDLWPKKKSVEYNIPHGTLKETETQYSLCYLRINLFVYYGWFLIACLPVCAPAARTRDVMKEFSDVYEQQYAVALFNSVRFEIEGGGGTQSQLLHRKASS